MVKVDELRFTHLKRSPKSVEGEYDYIIIDTPPSIGAALKNVLSNEADVVKGGSGKMAASSIFHNVVLRDPKDAEAEPYASLGILLIRSDNDKRRYIEAA